MPARTVIEIVIQMDFKFDVAVVNRFFWLFTRFYACFDVIYRLQGLKRPVFYHYFQK